MPISNWIYENGAKHFDPYHPYFTSISLNFQAASKPCKRAEKEKERQCKGDKRVKKETKDWLSFYFLYRHLCLWREKTPLYSIILTQWRYTYYVIVTCKCHIILVIKFLVIFTFPFAIFHSVFCFWAVNKSDLTKTKHVRIASHRTTNNNQGKRYNKLVSSKCDHYCASSWNQPPMGLDLKGKLKRMTIAESPKVGEFLRCYPHG